MTQQYSRGLWVAFFGPDGVGKSTVIEQLEQRLEPGFHGILRFHFRPGFHRHGHDHPPVTQPHAKQPRGVAVSFLKLIYWLADCWFGYLTAVSPCRRRRGLVIFDRYLPDMLVDPTRYRLPADCLQFAGWLTTFAPQPDLYVLLDAPAEVVQERKSELTLSESRRQRAAYLKMFESLRCKLIVNADSPVNDVAQNIGAALASLHTNSVEHEPSLLCQPLS